MVCLFLSLEVYHATSFWPEVPAGPCTGPEEMGQGLILGVRWPAVPCMGVSRALGLLESTWEREREDRG